LEFVVPELITEYTPIAIAAKTRSLAVRTWLYGSLAVTAWLALTIVPALAEAAGILTVSSPLYTFFGYICHRIPERSLHIAGEQLGVCSRCFGVYFGLAVGFLIYPLWRTIDEIEPLPRIWLFLSMIPIGVDWSLTIFGIWDNTHLSRFVTGTILGFACATYIVPASVEITRNFTVRRLHKT
jgi:uncharacterized membrane protein